MRQARSQLGSIGALPIHRRRRRQFPAPADRRILGSDADLEIPTPRLMIEQTSLRTVTRPGRNPGHPARRILVVDDCDYIRDMLSAVLVKSGYHIATAANGADALQHIACE